MRLKNITHLFIITLFVIGCAKNENDFSKLNEKELIQKQEEFYKAKQFQKSIDIINEYVKKFPTDTVSPQLLIKSALIYYGDLKDFNHSIEQYKRILNEYPQSKEYPNTIFTLAFIYNNDLKDTTNAKTYYGMFLQKFPTHDAAASAKIELENLGKSNDDILKKIEESVKIEKAEQEALAAKRAKEAKNAKKVKKPRTHEIDD